MNTYYSCLYLYTTNFNTIKQPIFSKNMFAGGTLLLGCSLNVEIYSTLADMLLLTSDF